MLEVIVDEAGEEEEVVVVVGVRGLLIEGLRDEGGVADAAPRIAGCGGSGGFEVARERRMVLSCEVARALAPEWACAFSGGGSLT